MLRFSLHLLLTMLVLLTTLPEARSQQIKTGSPTYQCPGADFQFPIKGNVGWLWHDPRSQWYDPATNTLPDTDTGNRLTGNPIIHTGLDMFPVSQNASALAVYPLADGVVVKRVGSQGFNIWYPQQRVYSYFAHINHSLALGQKVYANKSIGTVDTAANHIHFSISVSQTPPPQNPDGTVDKTKLPTFFPFSDLDPNQTRDPSALFRASLADSTNDVWTGKFGPTVDTPDKDEKGNSYRRATAPTVPPGAPKNVAWTLRESTFCSGTTSTERRLPAETPRFEKASLKRDLVKDDIKTNERFWYIFDFDFVNALAQPIEIMSVNVFDMNRQKVEQDWSMGGRNWDQRLMTHALSGNHPLAQMISKPRGTPLEQATVSPVGDRIEIKVINRILSAGEAIRPSLYMLSSKNNYDSLSLRVAYRVNGNLQEVNRTFTVGMRDEEKPPSAPVPQPVPTPVRDQTRNTMTDPFAYCAAVGNIDTPDRRYTGPKFPPSIFGGDVTSQLPESSSNQSGQPVCAGCPHWRCMNGKVYTCTDSNHLRCDARPNTSRSPNAEMIAFCREHPNSDDFSPYWIVPGANIYAWRCTGGKPTIVRQTGHRDARGFIAEMWNAVPPR